MDPLDWAKEYAAKRTAEEKFHKQDIVMKYSSSALIDKNVRRSCNAGYLFLQDIYYSLGLNKICDSISEKYKFDYDLNDILSSITGNRQKNVAAPEVNNGHISLKKMLSEAKREQGYYRIMPSK